MASPWGVLLQKKGASELPSEGDVLGGVLRSLVEVEGRLSR